MDFFSFPRRVRSLQTFIDSQWSKNWAFLVLKCTSQPKCSVPMCHSVSHTHKFKSFSMLKIVKLIKTNALKIHWKRINFNFHTFRTEFPLAFFFLLCCYCWWCCWWCIDNFNLLLSTQPKMISQTIHMSVCVNACVRYNRTNLFYCHRNVAIEHERHDENKTHKQKI